MDVHEPGLPLGVVQRLRDGLGLPLVPPLREPVHLMDAIDPNDTSHACAPGSLDPAVREAWLRIGGYVAAADGLSAEEARELAASASGPELGLERAAALLAEGAASSSLPEAAARTAAATELLVRIECLVDVHRAVAIDGFSEPERARLREVAAFVLGAERVEAALRLCEAERAAQQARAELFGVV